MTYPADEDQAVFYNPVQVQNRDLSILMIALHAERRKKRMHLKEYRKKLRTEENLTGDDLKKKLEEYEATLDATELVRLENTAEDGITILDALAASGLRSIRYWKEIPGVKHVTINDLDPVAVERAHTNIAVNKLTDVLTNEDRGHGIRIMCGDATHEMYLSRRTPGLQDLTPPQLLQKDQWDIIDLDPYGSAAPFIDAAVQAVRDGGMLCVTCTDSKTACKVLLAIYSRKYSRFILFIHSGGPRWSSPRDSLWSIWRDTNTACKIPARICSTYLVTHIGSIGS